MRPPEQLRLPLFITDHPLEINRPHPPGRGIIYAFLMPSAAIKIGWTERTATRRAREMHASEVLGWCRGSLDDEAAIHARLAAWRIGRTEDFWPAREVWDVVRVIQDANVWTSARSSHGWFYRCNLRETFDYLDWLESIKAA